MYLPGRAALGVAVYLPDAGTHLMRPYGCSPMPHPREWQHRLKPYL